MDQQPMMLPRDEVIMGCILILIYPTGEVVQRNFDAPGCIADAVEVGLSSIGKMTHTRDLKDFHS